MKVADFVANWIADLANHPERTRVYAICGAGAMHLNDAICHHEGIEVVPMQHEQAATYAAECEARLTNNIAVVHVTAGPGGSNTLTGLACAYVDSIPVMVIAGQVTSSTMASGTASKSFFMPPPYLRQGGMNELPTVEMARPVTKLALTVTHPRDVRYHLERAYAKAMTGRKGPVYVEFPLDVQAAEVDPDSLVGADINALVGAGIDIRTSEDNSAYVASMARAAEEILAAARRPLVIVGNGVRLAGACSEFFRMVAELRAPVVSSWSASDIIATDHPYYIGRAGIFGDRASNYAVQNADVILAIGTRLSVAQTGHHRHLFAPNAKKIVVDIDPAEVRKEWLKIDLAIVADAKDFLAQFKPQAGPWIGGWISRARGERRLDKGLTSYAFVEQLSRWLPADAVVVTDVGFSFIPTMQELELRRGQRLIHSCGVSPMGWALPAAVGAAMTMRATPYPTRPGTADSDVNPIDQRVIVCLTGDGGLMLNVQELYTVAQRNLPILIVVYANNGYATMRIAQNNHFKRESISGPQSGLPISADMLLRVARAFGIHSIDVHTMEGLPLTQALESARRGPVFMVLRLPEDELITPRVQAAMEDGKFKEVSLTEQWPALQEDVHAA